MTELRYDGQVALVTGAGGGLGLAHATELARRGAEVAINDFALVDGEPLAEREAARLRAEGHDVVAVLGDVGDEAQATALVTQTVDTFGRIDVLINNAGGPGFGSTQETTTRVLAETLDVHLFGMFWTCREALQHMRRQDYGRIVNTSSALGVFGAAGSMSYVVAKAAVAGLTRAASLDNRDRDIRVNALAPVANTGGSKVYFDLHPEIDATYLDAESVAQVVAFLAHRSCSLDGETIAAAGRRAAHLFTAAVPGYASRTLNAEEVSANLDAVLNTSGFRILDSSTEQHEMLPTFHEVSAG